MQPTPTPGGQISQNWGNPEIVQKFRAEALSRGLGVQTVDSYIQQMQSAYQTQAGHQVQGAIAGNQGGITPGQAQQDPTAALNFLKGGGKIINTGADAQAKITNDAGQFFKSHTDKQGYVSPQDYNKFLNEYVQAGGNSDAFHKTFSDSYVSPNSVLYNTPDAKQARGALTVVKNVLDSYHKLQTKGPLAAGPLAGDISAIPILGKYLQANNGDLAAEKAHNDFLTGEVGNLRSIAGAGPNQGFRFNLTELNNISSLLPNAFDSKQIANHKLDELNSFMKSKMGVDLKNVVKGNYGQ